MKTVLLAGFAPFNGESLNPAWEAVAMLQGYADATFRVESRQLPCAFGSARQILSDFVKELSPALVVVVGQAGGRPDITIERVAINVDDAPIKDNAGQQPIDQVIAEDGPAAYFATLPLKSIVCALRELGIPASVSQSAGTFVCNHVFYGLMHFLATQMPNSRIGAGFIHIPYLPAQAANRPGAPSMALDTVVMGLQCAIQVALSTSEDRKEAGGTTH
ncbi:pyroglutamyl-peptidase I [Janthinobacterium aquaticum]|uniref:pyroglutamyl-peptidase I n=1 Tax=Janthinobacterium sp. FT58W TaxID=2654254 RepID=UPI0012655EA7|nr:pyroglutamyl-peptidase I [Janthinobacterium sp. FT58W]KAB8045408.1 pyroglutamyl-peptidase I [Janthinobacterium sp. FT58W]